jgi:hypothetical protein
LFSAFSCSSTPVPEQAEPAGSSQADVAPFGADGAGMAVTIDGIDRNQQLPVSANLGALLTDMTKSTDQNVIFSGTIYQLSTDQLDRFDDRLNCFAVRTSMVYDMLFQSDGSRPKKGSDPGSGPFSFATGFEPELDSFKCTQLKATTQGRRPQSLSEKALARFHGFTAYVTMHSDTSVPKATRDRLDADAQAAVNSLMSGADTKSRVYSCHWDNNDDTEMDGLLRIDETDSVNSQLRVLSAFAGG